MTTSAPIHAGDLELWVERRGDGPDVLLIAGLGDPAEAWQPQLEGLADRYRVTAFDNRGVGRSPLPDKLLSVPVSTPSGARSTLAPDRSPYPLRPSTQPTFSVTSWSPGKLSALASPGWNPVSAPGREAAGVGLAGRG